MSKHSSRIRKLPWGRSLPELCSFVFSERLACLGYDLPAPREKLGGVFELIVKRLIAELNYMDTIKKMLLVLVVNTLVMLISWAGLSLILLGVRSLTSPQGDLVKILSIHSYILVMFLYAFYLIFDLCEFLSTETKGKK